ncbi:hypothetical protein Micbo1qcDRAFT_67556 [Microdochium bolleyi]|uniref:Uncharacterized protein n=1 Tax=Microdochium bolleyi TaxID=196109 RepID=A0A136J0T5_9PEZI|nr:hypothetical protein Micbo1qcDRAFT_67556 [Microdochium bolleyi]
MYTHAPTGPSSRVDDFTRAIHRTRMDKAIGLGRCRVYLFIFVPAILLRNMASLQHYCVASSSS